MRILIVAATEEEIASLAVARRQLPLGTTVDTLITGVGMVATAAKTARRSEPSGNSASSADLPTRSFSIPKNSTRARILGW